MKETFDVTKWKTKSSVVFEGNPQRILMAFLPFASGKQLSLCKIDIAEGESADIILEHERQILKFNIDSFAVPESDLRDVAKDYDWKMMSYFNREGIALRGLFTVGFRSSNFR